ncbi:MAG: polyphenol oxidase family protein [Spirochaetes bacterium]|nr:polyphenol oxidase family protein [Spirochaetota bacterium]
MTSSCNPYNEANNRFFCFSNHSLTLGAIGKSINTIDYSNDLDSVRFQEIDLLSRFLGIEKRTISMLNQVHGDSILEVNAPSEDDRIFPDADGMITCTYKHCLVIRTADCVPIFAFDARQKVLGAAHSGWKGCRLNITNKLIKHMKSRFQSENNDLHIYILPSIGPDSYAVNMDVGSLFKDDIIIKGNKIYLNLWNNIARNLTEEGIPDLNIHQSGICTFINNTDYFSYRRGDMGRNLNFAMIDG